MNSQKGLFQRLGEWGPLSLISTSIRHKLLVALVGVALVPLAILGLTSYETSQAALNEQAFNQLEAVRTIKANQVGAYFTQIEDQIKTFSEDLMVVEAMQDFQQAIETAREENDVTPEQVAELRKELKTYYTGEFTEEYKRRNNGALPPVDAQFAGLDDDTIFLQYQYIRGNENELGSKELLDRADDQSSYSDFHGKYHPIVRSFLKKFGYYDIFLCDVRTGDIVYSVFKELDFTTSLKDGPYSTTNFGRVFQKAAEAEQGEYVTLVDYEPYTPSYEDAASFIASPIFKDGQKIGVAIFQMPIDRINAIMSERTGLGESGETYAVGKDNLFRNDSRFLDQLQVDTTIINKDIPVDTVATRSALAGESGIQVIDDYRGAPVLSAWAPVTIHNPSGANDEAITWALMSEIDFAEVNAPVQSMFYTILFVLVGSAVIVGVVSWLFARSFTQQTQSISGMLSQIGIGMFDARCEVISKDELGQVASSLNSMCDNTMSLIQSQDERQALESSIETLKAEVALIASGDLTQEVAVDEAATQSLGELADSVNFMVLQLREIVANVQEATLSVSSSANEIQNTTEHLSSGSESQSTQILDTTAAIDEMAVSIQQVSENTVNSADVAQKARENAARGAEAVQNTIEGMDRIRERVQDTSKRIKRLGESSQQVGEIVQLIGDIADRTSILALNASIQAAMAGEAGQGFAVVAEEVERLAERANDATKQIGTLIKSIQGETSEAIAAMEDSTREVVAGSELATEAGTALDEINTVSTELAELMQQISQAARQQARGAESVSKSMGEISEVTQQTAAGTRQAAVSVSDLAGLADGLYSSVSQFKLPAGLTQSYEAAGVANDDPTAELNELNDLVDEALH